MKSVASNPARGGVRPDPGTAKLYFMCGKMAAGKSTYARELARDRNALLLVQDEFVTALFRGRLWIFRVS
jgi:hypothetical protein